MGIVFWPVIFCENLVGPRPTIGLPSQHLREGTPSSVPPLLAILVESGFPRYQREVLAQFRIADYTAMWAVPFLFVDECLVDLA